MQNNPKSNNMNNINNMNYNKNTQQDKGKGNFLKTGEFAISSNNKGNIQLDVIYIRNK